MTTVDSAICRKPRCPITNISPTNCDFRLSDWIPTRLATFAFAAAFLFALCVGAARVSTAAGDPVAANPRLVLLYAPCSVGKQFLSPWNDSLSITPNLAGFAARSTVFSRHHTETGQSGISYASLFTGSQADNHGVFRHPSRLDDNLFLIAEAYADAGYDTFYWNGHAMASADLNYDQGIAKENYFPQALFARDPRFGEILRKLEREPEYKAFIVANVVVNHSPYRMHNVGHFMKKFPAAALGVTKADINKYSKLYRQNHRALTWNHRATLDRLGIADDLPKFANVIELFYRASINFLDQIFGRLVAKIDSKGLLDQSLIVFTADHGEVLYRESATFKWTHSMLLDHEVLAVPLIIHSPLIPATEARYSGVTRSIDVFPTMAGLSGIELPTDRGIQGVDLSQTLMKSLPPPDLTARAHTTVLVRKVFEQMYQPSRKDDWLEARKFFPDDNVDHMWVAIRKGDLWFKRRKNDDAIWTTEVFDLAVDPDATHDIFDANVAQHAAMRDELLAYKAMLAQSYRSRGKKGNRAAEHTLPDQREAELLRKLGYIE